MFRKYNYVLFHEFKISLICKYNALLFYAAIFRRKRYYTFYIVEQLKIIKLIIHLAIERKVG